MINKKSFFILISMTLLFLSCTGNGTFAIIAVSDKIEPGSLPEQISPTTLIYVPMVSVEYAFFSSGTTLWARDISQRGIDDSLDAANDWFALTIQEADGSRWDGIQSLTASDTKIYLALYKISNEIYSVDLFSLTSFTGSKLITVDKFQNTPANWKADVNEHRSLKLFCPNPVSGLVYANELIHGEYGGTDSKDADFKGSILYSITDASTDWNTKALIPSDELNGGSGAGDQAKMRYITGAADNGGGTVLFSSTTNLFSTQGGALLDSGGSTVDYGSTTAITGITWLPTASAFIMGATGTTTGTTTFDVFTSSDGALGNWAILAGASDDFLTINFLDISHTFAGGSADGGEIILAGTSSLIDNNSWKPASGYQEIDVSDSDPHNWVINHQWNDYLFAHSNNYSASPLSNSTIQGLHFAGIGGGGAAYLYASTRQNGLWSIDANWLDTGDVASDPKRRKPSWIKE